MRSRLTFFTGGAGVLALTLITTPAWGQSHPKPGAVLVHPVAPVKIVERIIARINDKVITSVQYAQARSQLKAELKQHDGDQAGAAFASQSKNLLRDLIDQRLLLERASDMGLSAETDTIRRLDSIRRSMHLPTMRALRQAIRAQGMSYSEFRHNIRDEILTRKVIETDVAPRIQITPAEIKAYYLAHRKQFIRPDEVDLAEIFISRKGKPTSDWPKLKKLAREIQARVANGASFSQMAEQYSNGTTAVQGGGLGYFQKSQLAPSVAQAVLPLANGHVTPVLTRANGYYLYKVLAVHHAGVESLASASQRIENVIYQKKLGPEVRRYLTRMRHKAYIKLAQGFVDTGSRPSAGVNLTRFERVLPQDMPKPIKKPGSGNSSGFTGG